MESSIISIGCFVCQERVTTSDVKPQYTETSQTPVFTVLEQMLGYSLVDELNVFDLVCPGCLDRFNQYDEAFQKAKQITTELVLLFSANKVTKLSGEEEVQEEPCEMYVLEEEYTEPVVEESKYESFTVDATDFLFEGADTSNNHCKDDPLKILKHKIEQEQQSVTLVCKYCNLQLSSEDDLKSHECLNRQFICDICGQRYKTKSALSIHMAIHIGKAHRCTVCGKSFTQRGALTRHMPMHTGEKMYQCDKCGKQFIHYSSFHMHKLAHDNVRRQQCTICGLELRSTSHLSRHMRVHSGEKPHACPKCGQLFAQRYNMMAHLKAHQGINRVITKNHKCTICTSKFAKPCLLRDHMLNKHKMAMNSIDAADQ